MSHRNASLLFLLLPCIFSASPMGTAVAASRSENIDRSHPLDFEYWQPYGIVTTAYETPHVKWAKPLAGGSIKVLIAAPTWSHRETVELAQRLDIRFTPWLCYNSELVAPDMSDPKAIHLSEEVAAVKLELVTQLLSQYLESEHDVIVIGKIRWSALPAGARAKIAEMVRSGTGLVYVCPPDIDPELEELIGNGSDSQFQEVLRGVPWRDLPRLRHADEAKLVRTSTSGNGRVVVLDYQQPRHEPKGVEIDTDLHCLTPDWVQAAHHASWPRDEEAVLELGPYEYYQSLVARAIRWAAGRSAAVTLRAEIPSAPSAGENVPISIHLEGAPVTASVSVAVRSNDGHAIFERSLPIESSAGKVQLELPAAPAGQYILDMWARDAEGSVLEWGGSAFKVVHDNSIEDLELLDDMLEAGDKVEARFHLSKPLLSGQRLSAELWDLHGRHIDTQESVYIMQAELGGSAHVSLGPLAPLHTMHELRLVISENGKTLLVRSFRFPVRAHFRHDDFASLVWANTRSCNSLPTFYMLKKLREVDQADVLHTLPGSYIKNPEQMQMRARNCATANLMIGAYNGGFGHLTAPEDTHVNQTQTPWHGCLADSKTLDRIGRLFRRDGEVYGPYGPFVWSHGDESLYSADPDLDWHPAALDRFRRLLAENLYPSLEALNREWGTEYTAWDQVMPIEFAEAKQTGNFAPWVTHKLSSDVIYAELYKQAGDFIREGDPGARTGLDGDEGLHGPNSGFDWWLLSKNIQLFQSYNAKAVAQPIQSEVKRSFGPADSSTVRGLWYGAFGGSSHGRPSRIEYFHYHPWYSLLHHMNTTWFWTMGAPGPVSGYAPDLTSLGFMESQAQALAEIKSGIGRLVLSGSRADDGIAIHFSESSRIVNSLYSERSDVFHCIYEDALGDVARTLEDSGFQYNFVAYEQIEQGELADHGYKVLFLPNSRAISDREVENILEFARNGGLVVADIMPAILKKSGAKRPASALAELFPRDKPDTVTEVGKGRAVLIGTDTFSGYYRMHGGREDWRELRGRWGKMAELLQRYAGMEPAVSIKSLEGEMPPTEIARFDAGGIELVGLMRSYFLHDNETYTARIHFPRTSHLYDVRAAEYLGHADRCDRPLNYQAEVLALSPYRVEAVRVKSINSAVPGVPLILNASVEAGAAEVTGHHVLRVTITGPDGGELEWYAQNILAAAGRATITVPLALNEVSGVHTIHVKDVMSGVSAELKIDLGSK